MNLLQAKKAVPVTFKLGITPFLWGVHGIGKSQAIYQLTKEMGIDFIDLRLGQMEVGDLLGLPEFIERKGNKFTMFAIPDWFPKEGTSGILFLDELNRATRDVLQAVFQLILDRRLHQYKLPNTWHIVAAGNPSSSEYFVTEMEAALKDRFCHIKVESDFRIWMKYAESQKFHESIVEFINVQPELLNTAKDDFQLEATPSNRSWEFVSKLELLKEKEEIDQDLYEGILDGLIGEKARLAYMAYLNKKNKELLFTGKEVLNTFEKYEKILEKISSGEKSRVDVLNKLAKEIDDIIKEMKTVDDFKKVEKAFVRFFEIVPAEITYIFARTLITELKSNEHPLQKKISDIFRKDGSILEAKINEVAAIKEKKEKKKE